MKAGDLVCWSLSWIVRCSDENKENYRKQLGFILGKSEDVTNCWIVVWDDGQKNEVHRDYLEVINESR